MNAARIAERVIAPLVALVVAVAGIAFAADNLPVAAWEDTPASVERIEKDSPEWDCATMGNRICGGTWNA